MQEALKMKTKQKKEMIKKGKTFIKKYSWRKMAEETLKIYKKINSKAACKKYKAHCNNI